MRLLPDHPPHVLRYATLLTGGVALLVLVAFGLSGNFSELSKVSNTATVICSSPSQCEEQVGAGGYIRAAAGQVVTGNSTTISWNGPTSAIDCFGNGTTCGSVQQTLSGDSYEATLYGSNYLVLANRSSGANVYKWVSGSSCWGNGTSCGVVNQYIGGGSNHNQGIDFYGSYLLMTNRNTQSRMYQWLSSGTGCPSGGGWGVSGTCGTDYQSINPSQGGDQSESGEVFSAGGGQYYIYASNAGKSGVMYRWMSSGTNCPTGGGWGNGVNKCGEIYQELGDNSWDATDWEFFGGQYGLLSASNASSKMYVWTSSGAGCPANGGFGDGTSCNGNIQTFSSTGGRWSAVTAGDGSTHLILALSGPGSNSPVYKLWGSGASACLGRDNDSCGTAYQSLYSSGGYRSFSSANINGSYYLFGAGDSSSFIYKWMSSGSGCPASGGWGNGTTCGTALQTIAVANGRFWTPYTISPYSYALLSTSGATTNNAYRYMPACSVTKTTASGGTVPFSSASSHTGLTSGALTEDATFTMTCQTAGGGSLTASIVVDVVPKPTVSVAVSTHAAEPSSPGYFTISALTPVPSNLVVNYTTTGVTATAPPAPGYDYYAPSGTVTILQGEQTALVAVAPVDDTTTEGTETMRLNITSNPSTYTVGAPTNATMNIANSGYTLNVQSTGTTGVSITGTVGYTGTTNYSKTGIANGTAFTLNAPSTATAPSSVASFVNWSNCTSGSGTTCNVTMPASAKTVIANYDLCSSLTGTQSSYPSGSNGSPPGSCTGPAGYTYNSSTNTFDPPTISTLTVNNSSTDTIAEGGTTGVFLVSATPTPGSNISVGYTLGGTAQLGSDYLLSQSSPFTYPSGQSGYNITVTPVNDSEYEGTETITFTLNTSASYTRGTPYTQQMSLVDNETSGSLPTLSACTGSSAPPTCSLAALEGSVPVRWVQSGDQVTVSVNVTGLVTGDPEGNTCEIRSYPSAAFNTVTWPESGTTWIGSWLSNAINQTTIFVLTCTAPNGSETSLAWTVRVVPRFFEI